ncbi:MAG: PAS domain-containing protein [Sphingobacteriales bacterium]
MRSGALRIALIYLSIALAWIAISDRMFVVYHNLLSTSLYHALVDARRYVFILVTGFLIYRLVSAHEKKMIENEKRGRRNDEEVKRLGKIITKVNNIIIITNKDGFIAWVNKSFESFTGYVYDEVAGYAPATFFAGEETDIDVLGDILNKKKALESFSTEINCHDKYGTKFWVYGEYTPLFDDDGEFTGYIAVYNDITGLKQKERETIRQNEKLKEVAWLSSHEIRRPLANIIGLANMMKVSPYMDEKLKILENLNQSAEELDKIVHTINSTIEEQFELAVQPTRRF